ncbi:cytochrome P450 [Mycena rosella]|uniref:Cytochrome P450 n=1 Tax=Mycena rosella TaxID=1033263 RepID=A0AAD7M6U1_MYCRO|nr:cytochrome P450 [Mycena rosella]
MDYHQACLALLAALVLYLTLRGRSAIRHILGPPSSSWIFGHMRQLLLSPQYGEHELNWQKSYGPVYRLKGCFGEDRLMVSDPVALQYLINSPSFSHGPVPENVVNLLFGKKSVLGLKGEEHRRIRAALNVGFTAAAVRSYQPVFEKVARMITEQLERTSASSTDMCPLLGMATLGAVSEAVLGYSIEDLGDEFVESNTQVLALASGGSAAQIIVEAIWSYLPRWLLGAMIYLPTPAFHTLRQAKVDAKRLGEQIVRDKTDAANQGLEINNDVFSLLLQDTTGKALSSEEIVAQTAIILIAGQDTTSNTVAFGLLELAKHQEFQDELRMEIYSNVEPSGPRAAYDSMPLLNAFIKEVLRLYPTEPLSDRIALRDTVIPLADDITTADGEQITHIPVQKGQIVTQAILSYHRLASRWGKDANEFKPSRWLEGTTYQGDAVGPYANLLSFLGGPRTCLGWRFALLEMQIIICELVGKFSIAIPKNDPVQIRVTSTLLPTVSSGDKGAPLCMTRIL